ncbi:MAG: TolC family protein [Zoogloeaceae bacterium]|jgi:outer membrane protein TolC|nr:TolC family protein [Zoogloeaceae bacterium]
MLMFSRRRLALSLLALLAATGLSGCAMLIPSPDLERLVSRVEVPKTWQQADCAGAEACAAPLALSRWWLQLEDEKLTALIARGLAQAPEMRLATTRLRQAREARNLAASGLWPTLGASLSASRTPGSGADSRMTLYRAGFDAAWEPDLFGVTRQGVTAADAALAGAGARLEDAQVTLAAEIALNYTEARLKQEQLYIACRNTASQGELFEITRWRTQAGLATDLDVEQARATLAQTRASIPTLENSLIASLNQLDTLLGEVPGTLAKQGFLREGKAFSEAAASRVHTENSAADARLLRLPEGCATAVSPDLPRVPEGIAADIPAETLYRRPDVREAEWALRAEIASLRSVLAERFPSLRLSGSLGWQDTRFADLVSPENLARSLVASVAAQIFDGGRLKARIGMQDAVAETTLITYEQTLLTALAEVENALSSYATGQQRLAEREIAAISAQNAERMARQLYQTGLADFQRVLDAQRSRLVAEESLAVGRGDLVVAVIQLYKALGGGWTPAS